MKTKTYFMNNGNFDVRAMMTMGVSAKDNDNAIGFYGTGFKYAVAIILRGGGTVTVSTVDGVYRFTAKKESIRGKEFDLVFVNDKEAGFTTHLGINWEPWMAFRELYCNAKDEGGVISDEINTDYDTIIEVDSYDISHVYSCRSNYFIDGTPVLSTDRLDVFDGGKPYFYYRGVAVADAPDGCHYSYNIKSNVSLTEERLAKSLNVDIRWPIQQAWQSHCDDKAMLRRVVARSDEGEAAYIGFDADWTTSDVFVSVVGELMATEKGACDSAMKVANKAKEKAGDWPEFELSTVQQKMLDRAISVLSSIDIAINMFPVKTVTGLGAGVMGRAVDGTIYLSEAPFNMGTKQVASTLMEEWVHNKFGCADFDRVMQSWLFDKILSLSENITGEPV